MEITSPQIPSKTNWPKAKHKGKALAFQHVSVTSPEFHIIFVCLIMGCNLTPIWGPFNIYFNRNNCNYDWPVDGIGFSLHYIFILFQTKPGIMEKIGTVTSHTTFVILHFRSTNLSTICRSPQVFTQRREGLCSIGPANQQEKISHRRQLGRAVVMSLAACENGRCISLSGFVLRDHQTRWLIVISPQKCCLEYSPFSDAPNADLALRKRMKTSRTAR